MNQNTYEQMAIDAVRKIDTPAYYYIEHRDEITGEPYSFLVTLNRVQVAEVKKILAKCKDDNISLEDFFVQHPVPSFLLTDSEGFYQVPVSINIEEVFRQCRIKLALFRGDFEDGPEFIDTYIVLSENNFTSLLEWQLNNRKSGYNDLYNDYPELFKIVNDAVRNIYSINLTPFTMPAFTVELTSIKHMALEICGEPTVGGEIFSPNGGIMEHSWLNIRDRILNFCYERCVENNNGICVLDEYIYVENVDAIAIQKAFGVENYKSIYNYIKEHFNGCNGVRNFVDFLNQNQIDYTIRK